MATRRFMTRDERGRHTDITDWSGAMLSVNRYDEYGIPNNTTAGVTASGPAGRFGYTGQVWLPEIGMYYYRARIYSPTLGRFLQTDPIGYGDGMNLYAYVGGDPVNFVDPLGLSGIAGVELDPGLWICNASRSECDEFRTFIDRLRRLAESDRLHRSVRAAINRVLSALGREGEGPEVQSRDLRGSTLGSYLNGVYTFDFDAIREFSENISGRSVNEGNRFFLAFSYVLLHEGWHDVFLGDRTSFSISERFATEFYSYLVSDAFLFNLGARLSGVNLLDRNDVARRAISSCYGGNPSDTRLLPACASAANDFMRRN